MTIKKCPKCNDKNIEITFNQKLKKHTLSCYNCNKFFKISEKKADIKCPECESKNIEYSEIETVCTSCGLVLAATYNYVAGHKVNFPWS